MEPFWITQRVLTMTTIAIISILALLLIIGLVLVVVSQMREKARIEQMRRIKALEDGHSLLRRFVDELPNSFLDKPLRRLMVAQDTGGAIKGAVRSDFFWGFGDEAGAMAGKMKQEGAMWVLLPPGVYQKDATVATR